MSGANGVGYFDSLNDKWTQNVQAYEPVATTLREAPLNEAISGVQTAGEAFIRQIGARTGVYGDKGLLGLAATEEAAKFAKQARAFSELQRIVGETKIVHETAIQSLRLPKELEEYSQVLGAIDGELPGKIEAAASKIRNLEERVGKLASAEKSLKALVPKINEVWSKYIAQFHPKATGGFLSYLSWGSAPPKPEHLIFTGGDAYSDVCGLSSRLQQLLMGASDPAKLGEELKGIASELTRLGNVLDPTDLDERGGASGSVDDSSTN